MESKKNYWKAVSIVFSKITLEDIGDNHRETAFLEVMAKKFEGYVRKIKDFYRKHKRMPSYGEIMELVGFKSKNAVFKLINKMRQRDLIEKDNAGKIIPKHIFGEVRVLGTVEAGWPSPAEEELTDTMSLDEYLIKNKEATFMLKVKGDSMQGAGILPGDMVLVERGGDARDGDIVIAEVDHQWTMKYIKRQGKNVWLVPANEHYKPFLAKEELNIAAIVRAVIRKY
jgi:SOS regulatory protein LexA